MCTAAMKARTTCSLITYSACSAGKALRNSPYPRQDRGGDALLSLPVPVRRAFGLTMQGISSKALSFGADDVSTRNSSSRNWCNEKASKTLGGNMPHTNRQKQIMLNGKPLN